MLEINLRGTLSYEPVLSLCRLGTNFFSFYFICQGYFGHDVVRLLDFKKGMADWAEDPVLRSWSPLATTKASNGTMDCPRGVAGCVVQQRHRGHVLQDLSIIGNSFSPLTSLRHFDLSDWFYGPIPGRLVNLSGLVHVNLSHNYFSSGFPTDGIRQLQNLCCIDLRNNSVWPNGSDLLTELCNAEHIDASHNLFTSLELAN